MTEIERLEYWLEMCTTHCGKHQTCDVCLVILRKLRKLTNHEREGE